jgi:hypothetical protein
MMPPDASQDARTRYFHALPHEEQLAAIRRLSAAGQTERTIAAATALSVEMIRRVLEGKLSA